MCVIVAILAASGAFALTGSGDSPVGALDTVPSEFSGPGVDAQSRTSARGATWWRCSRPNFHTPSSGLGWR